MRQTLDLRLPGDIDNLLRGLASLAADMPQGEYRRGYQAALTAVGVSLGMEQERAPEPSRPVRVFEGIEDTPWAIRAFANVGGGMMDTERELIDMALSISAAGGSVADAIKKQVFHAHGIDWPLLLTLAEVLRINAATLALLAEREIERAGQPALDFGDMLPGDYAECAMCDSVGVERLSNVTIGPAS